MRLNGTIVPKRFPRVFKKPTRITFQIRSANTVQIGHDYNEASDTDDGLQLTQANTSTNFPPFTIEWQGELWYSTNVDNIKFVIVADGATAS